MSLEFVSSNKGSQTLAEGGSLYLKERMVVDEETTTWTFESHILKCKTRVYKFGGAVLRRIGQHCHAPVANKIDAASVEKRMLDKAVSSHHDVRPIIIQDSVGSLPSVAAALQSIRSSGIRQINVPANPHSPSVANSIGTA